MSFNRVYGVQHLLLESGEKERESDWALSKVVYVTYFYCGARLSGFS